MGLHRIASAAAALLLLLSAAACGPGPNPPPTAASTPATLEPAAPAATVGEPATGLEPNFAPSNFDQPTTINNSWMPMKPGTRYVYEGTTVQDDGTVVPHRIVINITDLTKVIGGVRSVATWDLDYSDEQLVEAELAFFAQDKAGNVWRMGEYPEEYENGEFVAAPTWIHGFADARAGIAMMAQPQLGTPSYAQGWGPAVNWTDRGQVDQLGVELCVPYNCFKDVLVIAETSEAEKDAFQLKSWAKGVGNIHTGWRGASEKTKEVLQLIEVVELSPDELAKVRAEALAMEQHAYEISKDVYGQTPPLEPASAAGTSAPAPQAGAAAEIVFYAVDLPANALAEFELLDDPASPGGKFMATPNTGGNLDPPPENDPNVIFTVPVEGGVPYRCWVHMKVGTPEGLSQANVLWVQFSGAVDAANQELYKPDTGSYLTAQGPAQEGWAWVGCNLADAPGSEPLVTFSATGESTVRLQAGMEGVGFDQLVLSPAQFLKQPPAEAIVKR